MFEFLLIQKKLIVFFTSSILSDDHVTSQKSINRGKKPNTKS